MTAVDIRRLAIRCHGNAEQTRAFAVRKRLEAAARGPLGSALDQVIHEVPDATVDRLVVAVDFDPLEHDIETIAALWADRIRAALANALTGIPASSLPQNSSPGTATAAPAATSEPGPRPLPAAAAQARFVALLLRAPTAEVAALAIHLRATGRVGMVWSALDAIARHKVLTRIEDLVAALQQASAEHSSPSAERRSARAVLSPGLLQSAGTARSRWERAWRALAAVNGAQDVVTAHATPAALVTAVDALATAGRDERRGAAHTDQWGSAAGGLVLLYPWLGEYLQRAVDRAEIPPDDARRIALTALADPAVPGLQHDPLVRALAGFPPDSETAEQSVVSDPEADAVLRAFAKFLPGFERSTPDFLRAHFIRRPAVLEFVDDDLHVMLQPAPLDVLVARLPYPLGAMALPWTPTLRVHLAPG